MVSTTSGSSFTWSEALFRCNSCSWNII